MTTALQLTPTPRRNRYLTSLRTQLRGQLTTVGSFLGIMTLLAVAATVMVDRLGDVEMSIVQFGRHALVWFPFSMAVVIATTALPAHVAAGMTRRTFGRASVTVALVLSAVYAAFIVLAFGVEQLVFQSQGWAQGVVDGAWFAQDASALGAVALDYVLLLSTAQLSGLLVGMTYLRVGGWWGTLALPLTAGPVLLVTALLGGWPEVDVVTEPLRVGLVLLLVLAVLTAYTALLRRVTIPQSTT